MCLCVLSPDHDLLGYAKVFVLPQSHRRLFTALSSTRACALTLLIDVVIWKQHSQHTFKIQVHFFLVFSLVQPCETVIKILMLCQYNLFLSWFTISGHYVWAFQPNPCAEVCIGGQLAPTPEDILDHSHGRYFRDRFRSFYVVKGV